MKAAVEVRAYPSLKADEVITRPALSRRQAAARIIAVGVASATTMMAIFSLSDSADAQSSNDGGNCDKFKGRYGWDDKYNC